MRQAAALALTIGALGLWAQTPRKFEPQAPPEQPVAFSHKVHAPTGVKCQDCHPNPEPGERMTLPSAAKCMACHMTIAQDRPAIRKVTEFAKAKEPIPWKRVDAVAAGVYWSHRTHLAAGVTCEDCHGRIANVEAMARVKDVTSMGACMECHKARNAGLGCELCHEGK